MLLPFSLLFVHWLADFVCQSDEMALGKSWHNGWLTVHVAVYTFVMAGWAFLSLPVAVAMGFLGITFVTHWVTDYYTSRLTTRLWKANQRHWFFVAIGADQLAHYAMLMLTLRLVA